MWDDVKSWLQILAFYFIGAILLVLIAISAVIPFLRDLAIIRGWL